MMSTIQHKYKSIRKEAISLIGPKNYDVGGRLFGSSVVKLLTEAKWAANDIDICFCTEYSTKVYKEELDKRRLVQPDYLPNLVFNKHTMHNYMLYDLTVVLCAIDKDGIFITHECYETLKTGLCHVKFDHIQYPHNTLKRINKYRNRGYVIPEWEELELLNMLWDNISPDDVGYEEAVKQFSKFVDEAETSQTAIDMFWDQHTKTLARV